MSNAPGALSLSLSGERTAGMFLYLRTKLMIDVTEFCVLGLAFALLLPLHLFSRCFYNIAEEVVY